MHVRVLLMTGKGGVGKTSVAAATALACAERGRRTLVVSTDTAHSLADSLGSQLGGDVTEASDNLFAQEIDVHVELQRSFGAAHDYWKHLFASQGVKKVVAEEMAVLPGAEELSLLLRIREHIDAGEFDVLVVDCAPTGATLRLLSFPDVLRWFMRRLFHVERTAVRVARPVLKHVIDVPLPTDDVYASLLELYQRVEGIKELLTDARSCSVRLICNPERMAIEETKRAFTHLCLYGLPTDGVIVNRSLPPSVTDPFFAEWKSTQARYLEDIEAAFAPLPILNVPLFAAEIVGLDALRGMADAIYGDTDPADVLCQEPPVRIEQRGEDGYTLKVRLPFAAKENIRLLQRGAELTITANGRRRNLLLPHALARLSARAGRFEDGWLSVSFGPAGPKRETAPR
jgi:arsenite-transporting ATPase